MILQNETHQFANQHIHSDVFPFEIVRSISDKTIEIRSMRAALSEEWTPNFDIGGFSAHCTNQNEQKWDYSKDEDSYVFRIRRHKKSGDWKDRFGNRYLLSDKPQRFHDYNY